MAHHNNVCSGILPVKMLLLLFPQLRVLRACKMKDQILHRHHRCLASAMLPDTSSWVIWPARSTIHAERVVYLNFLQPKYWVTLG